MEMNDTTKEVVRRKGPVFLPDLARLKQQKKLSLVIRLENVLVDVFFPQSVADIKKFVISGMEDEFCIICSPFLAVARFRPLLLYFLESICSKYEIIISSLLEQDTFEAIVNKIDPKKKYFGDRVFGKGFFEKIVSKGNGVLDMFEKSTIILDSDSDCWKNSQGYTLFGFTYCSPYHYFSNKGDVFLDHNLKISVPPKDKIDCVLSGMSYLLIQIHEMYFVKYFDSILEAMNTVLVSTLYDTSICYAGDSDSVLSAIERLTLKYGGRFFKQYNSSITHVITDSPNNPTVEEAKNYCGVHFVTIDWFIDSCLTYKRKREIDYPVYGLQSPSNGSRQIFVKSSDSSDISSSELDNMFIEQVESDSEILEPEAVKK